MSDPLIHLRRSYQDVQLLQLSSQILENRQLNTLRFAFGGISYLKKLHHSFFQTLIDYLNGFFDSEQ